MGFLAPLFLFGALAAAVPLLLHLRRRDRQKIVVFPSLMFLRGSPPPALKRRRLDNLLLLAVRMAIVLALAVAFARPVVRQLLPGALLEGGRDVVILVDRSPSMRVGDGMEGAQRAALQEIAALGGRDRGAVVAFADRATALTTLTGDRGRLESAVRGITPSGGATRYAPALQLAARLLADGERADGEIVLTGDLQRVGWSASELGLLPAGTRLRVVAAGDSTVAVPERPVSVQERTVRRGDRELATVSVRSGGGSVWRLLVDGRASGEVRAEGVGVTTADFAALPLPERPLRAHVPLADGGPDDAIRLVLERGAAHDVAVVRGVDAGSARGVVSIALSAAESPSIQSTVWRGTVPPDRVLLETVAVVLDDARVGNDDAERLLRWVETGGGLILGLGPNGESLPAALAAVAGVTRGALIERPSGTIATIDRSSAAFSGSRGAGVATLPGSSVWRYYRLTPGPDAGVLIRADDGSALLTEQRVGRGRVLTWASTLDDRWGTVVRHPGFVPLVHGLVFSAAGSDLMGESITTGSSVDLAALVNARYAFGEPTVDGEVLTLAGPEQERREVTVRDGSALTVLDQPGFYEIRRGRGAESGMLMAVNVPEEEWSTERIAGEEMMAAVSVAAGSTVVSDGTPSAATPAEVEREQRIWWWALLAVGALLAVEGVLANRLARPYVSGRQSTGGVQ